MNQENGDLFIREKKTKQQKKPPGYRQSRGCSKHPYLLQNEGNGSDSHRFYETEKDGPERFYSEDCQQHLCMQTR